VMSAIFARKNSGVRICSTCDFFQPVWERIVDVVWYGSGMIHWNGIRQPLYGKYGEFMVDNTL